MPDAGLIQPLMVQPVTLTQSLSDALEPTQKQSFLLLSIDLPSGQ